MGFETGKIYKIECSITGECYIGHTTMPLAVRLYNHEVSKDCSANRIIERGNYTIILLEDCPCSSKIELLQRERFYYDKIPNVNKQRPFVSLEERNTEKTNKYQVCKQKAKDCSFEYLTRYFHLNKERFDESAIKWREINIHILEITAKQYRDREPARKKERDKKYYELNPEKRKDKSRIWRESNPEKCKANDDRHNQARKQPESIKIAKKESTKIRQAEKINLKKEVAGEKKESTKIKQAEIIQCECGGQYNYKGKCKHINTAKHLKWEINKMTQSETT